MRESPDEYVLLYQDEASFYRLPSQAWLWAHMGRQQPKMKYTSGLNTRMRVVGYLNAHSGAVHHDHMSSVTVKRLICNLSAISSWYPHAKRIFLVWDNWFNHTHADTIAALQKQPRLTVLSLPTYAPWLNPIEKLWRWTKQTVSHAHPWSDDFTEFKRQVSGALDEFSNGSEALLRYTGLSS